MLTLLAYEDKEKKGKKKERKNTEYKMSIHSSSTESLSLCLDSESFQSQGRPLISMLRKEENHKSLNVKQS